MKKIVIPYNFSENSENHLNYGTSLAKELSTGIVLLNVIPYPVVTPEIGLPAFSYQDLKEDNLKELQTIAGRIKKDNSSIQHVECVTDMGDISESIVEYCNNNAVEFVVMGISQHDNKVMKTLMGSNAVETSHKTKCTVIVVPPNTPYKTPRVLAFASENNSDAVNPSFEKAKSFSTLFGAELQVLHVVNKEHHFGPGEVIADNHFEQTSGHAPHKLVIISEKKVSESLLGMLDNKLIDMILVEPKEHTLFYKLFHESVSTEIAFASPVPVVFIHGG